MTSYSSIDDVLIGNEPVIIQKDHKIIKKAFLLPLIIGAITFVAYVRNNTENAKVSGFTNFAEGETEYPDSVDFTLTRIGYSTLSYFDGDADASILTYKFLEGITILY